MLRKIQGIKYKNGTKNELINQTKKGKLNKSNE